MNCAASCDLLAHPAITSAECLLESNVEDAFSKQARRAGEPTVVQIREPGYFLLRIPMRMWQWGLCLEDSKAGVAIWS